MKKYLLLFVVICLFVVGCGDSSEKDSNTQTLKCSLSVSDIKREITISMNTEKVKITKAEMSIISDYSYFQKRYTDVEPTEKMLENDYCGKDPEIASCNVKIINHKVYMTYGYNLEKIEELILDELEADELNKNSLKDFNDNLEDATWTCKLS